MTLNYPTEFTAIVHHEEDGSYWAEVSELPGCFASGFDLDELQEALAEAIPMCLSDDTNGGATSIQVSAIRLLVDATA